MNLTAIFLFLALAAQGGLSAWDRSYLASLYLGEANRFTLRQRQSEIVGTLVENQMRTTTPSLQ